MKDYYNKIKALILKMNISKIEKDQFLFFFSKNVDMTEKIYNFYLQKQIIAKTNDIILWNQICKEEYDFLDNISSSYEMKKANK